MIIVRKQNVGQRLRFNIVDRWFIRRTARFNEYEHTFKG